MTSDRFEMPQAGPPMAVAFPAIERDVLANGLRIWTIERSTVPMVTMALLLDAGSSRDPDDRPGLAGATADLVDEGAGGRDAIALADALARLGTAIEIDVGPDVTICAMTSLSRAVEPALEILADLMIRPHLDERDWARVRDLRINRLTQLSRVPGSVADRAFLAAVLPGHPYGHGVMGTTRALSAMTLDDLRGHYAATFTPRAATLIVAGDIRHAALMTMARSVFSAWSERPRESFPPDTANSRSHLAEPEPAVWLVDRPGAPQSELRMGHGAPSRKTEWYHRLVVLNAILGGQFSSRLNINLRERRGLTYGVRSTFDLRRISGTFSCDTSIQSDATATAVAEVLAECRRMSDVLTLSDDELTRAKASLTRGYVRSFETASQLVRAASQLATFDLDDGTFDRFVPEVERVSAIDVAEAARAHVRPDVCATVIVGDAATVAPTLEALGRPVKTMSPEF